MDLPNAAHTSVELFAGGGGMAFGLRQAGFGHRNLIENNSKATAVLRRNATLHPTLWPTAAIVTGDVKQWCSDLPGEPETVDLVAGGPPCQPFSLSGAHAGENDERNMFPAALDVVRRLRPSVVLFENVPGLTRPSFSPYFDYVKSQLERPSIEPRENEMWWEHANRIGASRGQRTYAVHQHTVDAADLGVAQLRRRVFLVAMRNDVSETWPGIVVTHRRDALLYDQWVDDTYWAQHKIPQPDPPQKLRNAIDRLKAQGRPNADRWRTLRDALRDFPLPVDREEHDEIPNHAGIPGARTYAKHTGSDYDWPSKTIKAGVHGVAGGEAMIRYSNGTLRYLTIREAALLQGFPNDYEFPGTRSRIMGVIGNAVATPVAHAIGTAIAGLLGGDEVAPRSGPDLDATGAASCRHSTPGT